MLGNGPLDAAIRATEAKPLGTKIVINIKKEKEKKRKENKKRKKGKKKKKKEDYFIILLYVRQWTPRCGDKGDRSEAFRNSRFRHSGNRRRIESESIRAWRRNHQESYFQK
jgi:hypothetical protein